MRVSDVVDIKNNNIKYILNTLRFNDTLTKKDISKTTGLSFATVSNACNDLKTQGILSDNKVSQRRVGRMPNTITLNYDKFFSLAIDLQLEKTLGFAVVNIRNEILYDQIFDITKLKDPEQVALFCKQVFDGFVAKWTVKDAVFIGIGIAVPAVFDSNEGKLVYSAISMYENSPLKDIFAKVFRMPVYVDNIANIRALSAHVRFHKDNIVCLDISQGVGVGIISEGNLIRGKNGYATEVAHMPIGDPELQCKGCGGYGCAETELSISGMTSFYPEIRKDLPAIKRWEAFVCKINEAGPENDAIARRLGSLIGKLSTVMITMFDPEMFSINGYIVDIFDKLYPSFIREVKTRCELHLKKGLQILTEKDSQAKVYVGLSDAVYNKWNPIIKTD
jgi:predicted NBD/HSP70 family sugar kinase